MTDLGLNIPSHLKIYIFYINIYCSVYMFVMQKQILQCALDRIPGTLGLLKSRFNKTFRRLCCRNYQAEQAERAIVLCTSLPRRQCPYKNAPWTLKFAPSGSSQWLRLPMMIFVFFHPSTI